MHHMLSLSQAERSDLIRQATAVLEANWTGRFTKPAPSLYPHQWSWDAAFIAIGRAHDDQARAESELRSLFEGQWKNGLLPHIVFDEDTGGYFPGPDVWRIAGHPLAPPDQPASGIVQPPVHATAVLHIYRHGHDRQRARAFLAEMFPRLRDWHAYLYRERDPHGEGLVYIRHPWESGMDNSPLWDAALERIQPRREQLPAFVRKDILHVAEADRPTDADYDRYIYLVVLFAQHGYDEARIRQDCPFLIQDVLFNALLCQAGRDLAEIARELGEDGRAFEEQANRTARAVDTKLWDEADKIYMDYDLVAGQLVRAHVSGGFAPLFAGIPDAERARQLYDLLDSPAFWPLDLPGYPVPSNSPRAADYSPNRYWRGPVWIQINWLLMHGLRRYSFDAYAERIRQAIVELPHKRGFYEYFNPATGQGHGTSQFSWTAALLLDVLAEG
jgi:hypothetical protein